MTDAEWAYHRDRAIRIPYLNRLCSRLRNGLIKIEGESPMTENQILNWLPRNTPHWNAVLEKLRSLV